MSIAVGVYVQSLLIVSALLGLGWEWRRRWRAHKLHRDIDVALAIVREAPVAYEDSPQWADRWGLPR